MSFLQFPADTLRSRLLLPLAAVSFLASIGVAFGSYWLAHQTSERELLARYESVSSVLQTGSFPLNRSVMKSLALLTDTELLTATDHGEVVESTVPIEAISNWEDRLEGLRSTLQSINCNGRQYRAGVVRRTGTASKSLTTIVLFDEAELRANVWRATFAPLLTGLSTVLLLTTVTLFLTSRMVARIGRLHRQVQKIAEGEFETSVVPGPSDEIGRLASAIGSMSTQLISIWQTLNQREGERLLHQVASGLAHNLRNHLTGARMAIELHQRKCSQGDDEGLGISIHEIEQTESYVRRLLVVAAGEKQVDQPANVRDCLSDVQSSLAANAKHRGITLLFQSDDLAQKARVQDGPSLTVALTNLIFNSMQVATAIEVHATIANNLLSIDVIDDGPGPDPKIEDKIFEPFVTTKQEGVGLGLPLVRRTARRLGGDVQWTRSGLRTIFTLIVQTERQ